jgi:AraC family transcriptional activator of pobA
LKALTSSSTFIQNFISQKKDYFSTQKTPLKIFPLQDFANSMMIPFPMIKSNYNILIFIKRGCYEEQIETQLFKVDRDVLIYIPSGTIHSVLKMAPDIEGYFISIDDHILPAVSDSDTLLKLNLIQPVNALTQENVIWIEQLCNILYTEINQERPNRKIAEGLSQALLFKMLEISGYNKPLSRNNQIALQFKHLVNQHFKEEKGVQFYADKLAISSNYLNRCTQSLFYKSAKELILSVTILHSQLLMLDVTKDISQVCFELNFEDVSYFSRLYKKVTGQTPSSYRKTRMHDLS